MSIWFAFPTLLAAAALLLAGAAIARPRPPQSGPSVGQPYPAYILPSLADGQPRSIAEFRGRKVLLHQFASW